MFLADFHVHSKFSDGQLSITELVDLYGGLGFGAIAITDHICEDRTFLGVAAKYLQFTLCEQSFSNYLETLHSEAERAWRKYKMVVLPGFEISKNSWFNHRSAHILGIGISDYISADGSIETILDEIHQQGAISIAAHPVWTGRQEAQTYHLWNRREELRTRFDAWEVASGPNLFDTVLRSGLPMIASSDLHNPNQIRSWKTRLWCERHPQAILDAIRRQELDFYFYSHDHQQSPPPEKIYKFESFGAAIAPEYSFKSN